MQKKNLYKEDSIESLDPREFTRLRPNVYCGDTTYATQLLVEIFSNCVDEYNAGHGDKIEVSIKEDLITVTDNGQGFIPGLMREDGKSVLEASFSVLNTSGKYRENGAYEGTSLGSFGIGCKLTNFLSKRLNVSTYRDGKNEILHFEDGLFVSREMKGVSKNLHGTSVQYTPDPQFFTYPTVEIEKIRTLFRTIVCLCPGLTIVLHVNKSTPEIFHSKKGLNDLVDAAIGEKEIIKHRMSMDFNEGKNKMSCILTYTSNFSSTIVPYVNTGLTESGSHITQIKTTITREFNKFFKEKKWLKEKEENLLGDDIQEGMYVVFNITAPNVSYDAQVKSRVTKIDMTPFTSAFATNLQTWLSSNEKEVKAIFSKAAAAKKAREAAKKAREKVRENVKKKEKALKFDSKLADCFSKDRKKCEIYVVEGDSASGNLKMARNNEFQAVIPVRGKILNTEKATLAKIQGNAEIMTMIEAFGLDIDTKTLKITYHPERIRYGKIIIMSDADVDGAHIKNLFYTFIWNFCPELIMDGYIYAGVPPLYRVMETKDQYIYLKDDKALEEYRKTHTGQKYEIKRLKGLGEMTVDDTEQTLVDPETRLIKRITVADVDKTTDLFDKLMGTKIIPRKEFIVEHSKEAKFFE